MTTKIQDINLACYKFEEAVYDLSQLQDEKEHMKPTKYHNKRRHRVTEINDRLNELQEAVQELSL